MTSKIAGDKFSAGGLASAILESSHALVVIMDTQGRINAFNRACELLTGYDADELVGSYIWDKLLPAEDIESIQRYFTALQSSGEFPDEYENEWIASDGHRTTIAWNNSIVRNAAGEIELVAAIGVDITERRTAADRLARAQRIAGIGSWEWNVETDEEYWSDQFYAILGLRSGSIPASVENFYNFVHPDDRDWLRERIHLSVEARETYSADFRIIRADGIERLVHEEAEIVLDGAGKLKSLTGSIQDVTELRGTENRLQRLTRSFANAQRIAKIGNWDWDAVTRNEWWSEEIFHILGVAPGSVAASYDSFLEHCHPDDREKISAAIKTAQDNLSSYEIIFRIVRPDGEERVVQESGEAVIDEKGRLAGLTGTIQDITARHLRQRELSETAQRLEAAMQLTHLGNWEWNPSNNRLTMSEETLRICGLDPQHAEVDNDFLMAMIPAEEHERVLEKMRLAVSSRQEYTNEYHIVRPDGDKRSVLEHGTAVRDEATGEIRLLGTIQDITEKQRTAEELARTLQRLADSQRAAQIGSWEWDAETDRDWWSEQQMRNYGLDEPAGFVHGERYLDFAHPDDREMAREAVARSIAEATPLNMEFRTTGADGIERVLWVYGLTETDHDGRLVRAYGTTQDITSRKQTELAFQESEARLRGLFDNAPVGIGLSDTRGHLIQVNDAFAAFLSYTPDEMLGLTYRDVTHPDHMEASERQMLQLLSGEANNVTTEKIFIRKDGTGIWGSRTQSMVRDRDGNPKFQVVVVEDIDDRKRAEAELAKTTQRLQEAQRIAHIGHWEWLPDTNNSVWSEQVFRIFGMEPGDIQPTHDSFFNMVHEDDRKAVSDIMDGTMETWQPYETVFRVRRVDGSVRHIFERAERYIDEETGKASIRGIMQDITERKEAEDKLRETANRLQLSQKIGKLGSWEWNIRENREWWSDETYRLFGAEVGDTSLHDYGYLDYIHPHDREAIRIAEDRSGFMKPGETYHTEFRIQRPDGSEIFIHEMAETEFGTDGKPLIMRGALQDITERKIIEKELRETADKLEKSQSIAKIGSWVWEIAEDKEWWSDEIYRMFGMEVGEVVLDGYGFLDYVHPDDRDRVRRAQDRALHEGVPYSVEYRLWRVDGREIVVSEYGEMEYDADGNPIRMRGTAQDVTERKQAEQALRDTKERLEQAQELAQMGSWTWDPTENLEWWSDQQYRIFGLEPGSIQLDGWGFLSFVHPDDRDRVEKIERRAAETHKPFSVEYRIKRQDGTERVVSEQGEWVEDDAIGKPFWRGVVQDITERKAIEEKLRETTENLEESQRLAKLGSWVWDIESDTEWWSEEICSMLGVVDDIAVKGGYEFLNYIHPGDRDRVRAELDRALHEKEPYITEYRVRRADGEEVVFSERAETEYDKTGKAVRMRGTTQDVTERKRIEQELARLNAELEQRVEERTEALRAAQAELVKNERLATLGQLTATVSHELRNPLGAMRSSIYVVKHKVDSGDERLLAAIERINRNITRCDQIIDELLDYTRIRDLELQQTTMDEWLAELIDEQPVPDGLTVERQFDAAGIDLAIDPDRLRRAVINLYENACQALATPANADAPAPGAKVVVATRVKENRFEIIVCDNGDGIPAEISQKIFEPLFSTKNFGVGLGLPTVRRIMEQHGGGVEIRENPGGGANFALWLPLGGN